MPLPSLSDAAIFIAVAFCGALILLGFALMGAAARADRDMERLLDEEGRS